MHHSHSLIQLIQVIGKKYKLAPSKANEEHSAEIMRLGIPNEAKSLILTCWFQQYGQIDATEFFDIPSIIEESKRENIREKQFIPIGKSGNGDLLAVYWKAPADCAVGYLRFVDYIDSDNEMMQCFHQISTSLAAFFSEIQAGYEIPCDSYECKTPRRKILWWHFWVTR